MEKQRNMKKIALTVLVIGFILYCAAGIDYSGLASFSPSMAKDVIKGLCAPKWDYFYDGSGEDVFSLLLLTIGIAFLGTAIATVLAIPLMLISAANLWKGCPVVPRIGKLICNILRAFPELVYAIIFVKIALPSILVFILIFSSFLFIFSSFLFFIYNLPLFFIIQYLL